MIRLLVSPTRYQQQLQLSVWLKDYPEDQWEIMSMDALTTTIQDIVQEAYTFTLLGKQRLLLIQNAYFFTSVRKPSIDQEQDFDVFEQLFRQTLDLPHLIFLLEEDIDGKNKWVKLIKQSNDVTLLPVLKKQEWAPVLEKAIQERKIPWGTGATWALTERLYPDLDRAINELDKLQLLGETITEKHIQRWVPLTLESNVFELSNAILKGQLGDALAIFRDLSYQRVEPITLLTLMSRQFQGMEVVYALEEKGLSPIAIAQALNWHEYRVKVLLQAKKTFPLSRVENAVSSLADLDYQIKSGQMERFQAFETWLLNV